MALPENLPPPPGAPLDERAREGWHITDERSAEWVMRKLAHVRQRLAEQEELRAEYQQQLADWWDDATRGLHADAEWAERLLKVWALHRRHDDPDAKSVVLPSGRVNTRWVPPHPEVLDASTLAVALARVQHPQYDRVIRAEVRADARELGRMTVTADEWQVGLSCGCHVSAWQFGGEFTLRIGQVWPWRPHEHTGESCAELPVLTLDTFQRGRVGMPVTIIERPEEGTLVVPLDGVRMVAGRLAATVQPR